MKVKFMWVVISLYGRFTGLTIIFYILSINKVITHCVYFLFNRLVSNDFKNQLKYITLPLSSLSDAVKNCT